MRFAGPTPGGCLPTRTFYGDGDCLADEAAATVVGFTVIIPRITAVYPGDREFCL